ncbi:predicted protein [Uncinocarpus reesii 1704]|uniref:Methyltransferase domain-containing protein n=1 Tax=Uncinocarpus reesii (strain UAMH 1704) TaxID=336963 RepID=C4JNU1_UNCRE|nr:uncharacterized protein UREG_04411 [Uncinocarpus reesii 1704]EEP79565.1 predicted protein [Uncinocarpus reesii 1704]
MTSLAADSSLPPSPSPTREVYDTDGNFLQRLDTLELQTLIPFFLSQIYCSQPPPKIVDLGCGTGRNTISLLRTGPKNLNVLGLEPSNKMLAIARKKIAEYFAEMTAIEPAEAGNRVCFEEYNLLTEPRPPLAARGVDAVISTLVLEHVPVEAFFKAVAAMLKSSGVLMLTNMHPEMGEISQAGFVHPETGVKIRPTSYAHTVKGTLEEANAAGFELIGSLKETKIDEELAEKLGPRARKWIGVYVWFGGCFRKK